MFKIVCLDGTQKIPEDDICYIIAKGGVYLKKKVGMIESLAPVKNISILEDVQPYAKMNIPKISGEDFGKVMSFFKKVYEEHKSEAIVLLYYNPKKATYKFYVPHQKVSGAGVDYVKGVSIANHIQVGTIHSHANFSAFHSGTDDSDEEHFDGIHITIGDNTDAFPSITASIVINGTRFTINPIDYVTKMEIVEYTNYFPHMFRPSFTEINGVREYKSNVKTQLGYQLMISDQDKKFNEAWLKMIENVRPTITNIPFYTQEHYLDLFDPNRKDKQDRSYRYTWTPGSTKKNNRPAYNPCESCVFKKYKSDDERKSITQEDIQQSFSDIWDDYNVYDDPWGNLI